MAIRCLIALGWAATAPDRTDPSGWAAVLDELDYGFRPGVEMALPCFEIVVGRDRRAAPRPGGRQANVRRQVGKYHSAKPRDVGSNTLRRDRTGMFPPIQLI